MAGIPDVSELDQTVGPFILARAKSAADRRRGLVIDGVWVPGHLIRWVDGKPYAPGEEPSLSERAAADRIATFRKNIEGPR